MKTTFDTLKTIFIGLKVAPEAKLEDLWPDEVAQTEITLHIEDQFDVTVSEEEIEKLATVADLVALIDRKDADAMEDISYAEHMRNDQGQPPRLAGLAEPPCLTNL